MTEEKPKKCEECGKETEDLTAWATFDTEEEEVNIRWICEECQEEYEKEALL